MCVKYNMIKVAVHKYYHPGIELSRYQVIILVVRIHRFTVLFPIDNAQIRANVLPHIGVYRTQSLFNHFLCQCVFLHDNLHI